MPARWVGGLLSLEGDEADLQCHSFDPPTSVPLGPFIKNQFIPEDISSQALRRQRWNNGD